MIVRNPVKQYTPEDLLTMPDGDHYELVDGQLLKHQMSIKACIVATEVLGRLANACRKTKCGIALTSSATYQCFSNDPNKVRMPDFSFIKAGRLPRKQLRGHILINPDLAGEVVSPHDLSIEVENKVEEYLEAGVKLVWVIWPNLQQVMVHRADGTVSKLTSDQELTGEDVIPEFRCKVSELFLPLEQTRYAD